ncbi:MAG: polysaccharide biosynthesis-like protein [Hyphomicrobiales bacterium]|nr:MAG: polysaccharide biosynthesis-like protein [Hyphomicrobiales bacterium]
MSKEFHFRRDLLQSVGSSGFGLMLTLVTTPIMTRVFPAEAYGINGIMITVSTLLAAFGSLGLPVALARQQQGSEQARLLHASAQMAVMLTALSAVSAAAALLGPFILPSGMTAVVVLMLPFLVFLHCIQRIADSLVIAKGRFPAQAAARIINAVTTRGLTLALGWLFHPTAASMLVGDGTGKIAHIGITARLGGMGPDLHKLCLWPDLDFLRKAISDYRAFALQANVASSLPLLAALGVQVMLGVRLGTEAIGYYVFANSIITLPVTVIALASAPVVFHRLAHAADNSPDRLPQLTFEALLGYLAAGTVCMLPIAFFGPTIFVFAFGKAWAAAGGAAAVLAIPQIFTFALTGLLGIFQVTRRFNVWLGCELAGTVFILGGMILLPEQTDLMTAISFLAALKLCYTIVMLAGCIWASRQSMERRV